MQKECETEPNRKHFVDKKTGLDCLIVRRVSEHTRTGHLCGYVGVPKGHPWFGKDYDNVDADVHGGLTYSEKCNAHIFHHEPEDKLANKEVWWLGFDCAHLGDFIPGHDRLIELGHSDYAPTYKNIAYVEKECRSLANQAIAAQSH